MGRIFVISDVHGYYDLFIKLLNEISFNDLDKLYVCLLYTSKLQNIELCEIDNVSYNSNTNFLKLKENDAYSEALISFKLNIKVMFKFI